MSYSFSVKAPTKAAAKDNVSDQFDVVVNGQPTHEVDRAAVKAAAGAFIDMLAEPQDGDEIVVSINGSLSWSSENVYTSAAMNVNASLRKAV